MSNLPGEILDYIVDFLHDSQTELRNCCLVSKSWVPRTRRHLFADVRFDPTGTWLQSWKKMFPDASISPAHYTTDLTIACPEVLTDADEEVGGWIGGFSRVIHLSVVGLSLLNGHPVTLAALQGVSPVMKTLLMGSINIQSSQLFDLILSFPLLENLNIFNCNDVPTDKNDSPGGIPPAVQPPPMTGSLNLSQGGGMGSIARWLLSLPGGAHFRRLNLECRREGDLSLVIALVEECSRTLESLEIASGFFGTSIWHLRPRRRPIFSSRGELCFN